MTDMSTSGEEEETFREAVRSLATGDYAANLALGSLLASVQGDAKYELIAREETAPRAGEMDLHLTGESVIDHSANAAAFGEFVRRMAESVKIIGRERSGRRAAHSDLLVEPGPGSVRVIFRTPDPVAQSSLDADDADRIWSDPNSQSIALQQVAQLLASSEPGSIDESVVDGLIETLPAKVRPALVAMADSIAHQDWEVVGEFRQRGLGVQDIRISTSGARRLQTALSVTERERKPLSTVGHFDGHRRARSICWFIEEGTGKEITAVVPTPELLAQVAALSQGDDQRVSATFTVITAHGPGTKDRGQSSYILEAVVPLPPPEMLLEI